MEAPFMTSTKELSGFLDIQTIPQARESLGPVLKTLTIILLSKISLSV